MKALVIYDATGKIWSIVYGEEEVPQGLTSMFVDIPEAAVLERIDVTDSNKPKPVFTYLPDSDIGRLQKEVQNLIERVNVVAPEEKEPETLEEYKTAKKQEISQACEQIIYAGISVTLADGTVEHFALTEHDQLNLFGKQAQLKAGADRLEYHSDGQFCKYYNAVDMQTIIKAATQHVSYHTTYCNSLNMWVAGAESAEELQQIYYGADVPEQYQSDVLKDYLAEIISLAGDDADA